ncbi:hypothetical protein ES332_A04G034400v1 [Gossypium tomentosum]|uniref:Uncharacterized protein n=1 Tax=Gossypium tomentosum TaxID=34277 RepID=A0A5D2QVG2_GOSTO|nr:hypothetical protein ES332_A04G034400v1 [Gossypium tomentosum]
MFHGFFSETRWEPAFLNLTLLPWRVLFYLLILPLYLFPLPKPENPIGSNELFVGIVSLLSKKTTAKGLLESRLPTSTPTAHLSVPFKDEVKRCAGGFPSTCRFSLSMTSSDTASTAKARLLHPI